jgi:hypothetical protein
LLTGPDSPEHRRKHLCVKQRPSAGRSQRFNHGGSGASPTTLFCVAYGQDQLQSANEIVDLRIIEVTHDREQSSLGRPKIRFAIARSCVKKTIDADAKRARETFREVNGW